MKSSGRRSSPGLATGTTNGAVIDFVHVSRWPTFNVADSAVTIGAILLVIWAFRADRADRTARSADARADGEAR